MRTFVVGKDAATEAETRALAEAEWGEDMVIRGERVDHRLGCSHYLAAVVTDATCSCPRTVVFRNVNDLIAQMRSEQ